MGLIAEPFQHRKFRLATETKDAQRASRFTGRKVYWSVLWLIALAFSAGCPEVEEDVLVPLPPVDMDTVRSTTPGFDGGDPSWPLPPPPPRCIMHEQGDGMSCFSADTWKWSAVLDCENQPVMPGPSGPTPAGAMLRLEALELFSPCGSTMTQFLGIRYVCCPDPNTKAVNHSMDRVGEHSGNRLIERFGEVPPELNDAVNPQ